MYVKNYKFEKNLPKTEAKKNIQKNLIKSHEAFLLEFLEDHMDDEKVTETNKDLKKLWSDYISENMIKHSKNGNQLLTYINKVDGVTSGNSSGRYKEFDIECCKDWVRKEQIPNNFGPIQTKLTDFRKVKD